jgi:hypothetical protein
VIIIMVDPVGGVSEDFNGAVSAGAKQEFVPLDKDLAAWFRTQGDLTRQVGISPDGSRWTNRSKPWPETPFSRKVLVFLSPARRKWMLVQPSLGHVTLRP